MAHIISFDILEKKSRNLSRGISKALENLSRGISKALETSGKAL